MAFDVERLITEKLGTGELISEDEFMLFLEGIRVYSKEDIAEGRQWHQDHQISHKNVVKHYNQATPDEKFAGHHWYGDAHNMAAGVAEKTKVPMHTMAGLIANYSPQTHWHVNMHTASSVALHKKAVGGPGSGVFASKQQKESGARLLSGEHYDNVLKGHKVRHFAHLIEHGGNADEHDPRVVVDRHAHSVASGSRITDNAFSVSGLKGKKRYHEVAKTYHDAAAHISKETGVEVKPHQVQAVTWLVRQRLNAAEDKKGTGRGRHSAEAGRTAKVNWDHFASEHFPSIIGMEPGTGYARPKQ
jgi:hypothetical protein